jgi:predicted AAA+ superfamily ATPase
MDINKILELHNISKHQVGQYNKKRFIYESLLNDTGKHFTGIVGPRGSGKTILLKQLIADIKDSLYISLDSIDEVDLFELIKIFSDKYKYKTFFLDEIHYYKNYESALKKVFDFLEVKIYFTSSVALSLYESSHDLSRRTRLYTLYAFSYREFLYFKMGTNLPKLTIKDIINKNWQSDHLRYSYYFKEYLQGGILPFSLDEPEIKPIVFNIIDKIVYKDIPFIAKLTLDEVEIIKKIIKFIATSSVDGINYSTVAHNLKITKYKAIQYLGLLEKSFILKLIMPKGSNVLKEPKVLLYLPLRLLYREYQEVIGGLREDFFIETLLINNIPFYYLKSTQGRKTPDYLISVNDEKMIIEIGGKGKGRSQFKGISKEKSLILADGENIEGLKRPLYLIGYL